MRAKLTAPRLQRSARLEAALPVGCAAVPLRKPAVPSPGSRGRRRTRCAAGRRERRPRRRMVSRGERVTPRRSNDRPDEKVKDVLCEGGDDVVLIYSACLEHCKAELHEYDKRGARDGPRCVDGVRQGRDLGQRRCGSHDRRRRGGPRVASTLQDSSTVGEFCRPCSL